MSITATFFWCKYHYVLLKQNYKNAILHNCSSDIIRWLSNDGRPDMEHPRRNFLSPANCTVTTCLRCESLWHGVVRQRLKFKVPIC